MRFGLSRMTRRLHPPSPGGGGSHAKSERSAGAGGRGGVKLTRRRHPTPVAFASLSRPTLPFQGRVGACVTSCTHARHAILAVALGVVLLAPAHAADPRNPDWPCVQVKVPEMSPAAVWAGAPFDDVGTKWQDDAKLKDLVARLAARRTPLEDAQKLAAEFVTGSADKKESGRVLFAGLFDTLNTLRSDVINGIERYTRRQRDFATRIRTETLALRELQDKPDADAKQVAEQADRVQWETRIFEDRRRTISYVCEVPVLIEQRLFALGRAIQQEME